MPDVPAAEAPPLSLCSALESFLLYRPSTTARPEPAEVVRRCTAIQLLTEADASWLERDDVLGTESARGAVLAAVVEWLLHPFRHHNNVVFGLTLVSWYVARAPGGPRSVLRVPALVPRLLHAAAFGMGHVSPVDAMLAAARACSLLHALLGDVRIAAAAASSAAACVAAAVAAAATPTAPPPVRPWLSALVADDDDALNAAVASAVTGAASEGASGRFAYDAAGAAAFALRVVAVYPDRPQTDMPSATDVARALLAAIRDTLLPPPPLVVDAGSGGAATPGRFLVALSALDAIRTCGFTGDAVAALAREVRDAIKLPADSTLLTSVASPLPRLMDAAAAWPTHAGVATHALSAAYNSTCSDAARARLRFAGADVARAGAVAAAALQYFSRQWVQPGDEEVEVAGGGARSTPAPPDADAVAACTAAVHLLWSPASTTYGVEAAAAASLALPPPAGRGCAAALVPFLRRLILGRGGLTTAARAASSDAPQPQPRPPPARHVPPLSDFRALQLALELLLSWSRSPSVLGAGLPPPMRGVLRIAAARCGHGPRALGHAVPEGVHVALSALLAVYGRDTGDAAGFSAHALSLMDGEDDDDDGAVDRELEGAAPQVTAVNG